MLLRCSCAHVLLNEWEIKEKIKCTQISKYIANTWRLYRNYTNIWSENMKRQIHIFVRLNIDLRFSARAMAVSYLNNNMAKSEANEWNGMRIAHGIPSTLSTASAAAAVAGSSSITSILPPFLSMVKKNNAFTMWKSESCNKDISNKRMSTYLLYNIDIEISACTIMKTIFVKEFECAVRIIQFTKSDCYEK